jgi:hypothetical protein
MTYKTTTLDKKTANKLKIEFGDLEIIDAYGPLRLQPMRCDAEGAVRKDPTKCVFARTAQRMFGATKIIFWKTSAYVDLNGTDGVRHVERFIVRKDVLHQIEEFDRGKPFNEGNAFILYPPSHSHKLKVLRRQSRAYRKTKVGRIKNAAADARKIRIRAEARLNEREEQLQEIRTTGKSKSPTLAAAVKQVRMARQSVRAAKIKEKAGKQAISRIGAKVVPHIRNSGSTLDLSVRNGKGHYNFISIPT